MVQVASLQHWRNDSLTVVQCEMEPTPYIKNYAEGRRPALLLLDVDSGRGPLCARGSVSASSMVEMETGGMMAEAGVARALLAF